MSVCAKHDVKEPCWCCAQEKEKKPAQQEQKPKSGTGFTNPGK